MASSIRKAMYRICVVQLIFAALIGGLSAAYFNCGLNTACFVRYVLSLLFVVPSSIFAYSGMTLAESKKKLTRACVAGYGFGCLVLAALEAFVAVNADLASYGILPDAFKGFAALQAAAGITAFVYSQFLSILPAPYSQLQM